MTDAQHITAFCEAAEAVITDGIAFSRADDPHRFATLPNEFDGGKARRRLVVDYLAGARIRIALQLIGTQGGEERGAEVFAITVQAPIEPAASH